MEITESARKHGKADADILHAWDNALWAGYQVYDDEDRLLVIGPDCRGRLPELIAVPYGEPDRSIHANDLQPKTQRLLR